MDNMSKSGKIRKNILKQFKDFNDEEILSLLHKAISEYVKLTKSKKYALEILAKYNIASYYCSNENIIRRYFILRECANIRGLSIPSEWYNVEIRDEDIISRLLEFAHNERMWIDKHNYLFDLVNTEESISSLEWADDLCPSDMEQLKVTDIYNEIINKEFGSNTKNKLKKIM